MELRFGFLSFGWIIDVLSEDGNLLEVKDVYMILVIIGVSLSMCCFSIDVGIGLRL